MISQQEKAAAFQTLHQSGTFVIPNPWDRGSAQILAGLGYKALATTSAGFARSIGKDDYQVTRDMVMDHARDLCAAVDAPVSADLENGFGHTPEICAETIKQAGDTGLVGGSIEDFSGNEGEQYEISKAKDRVRAAVEAARTLPFPFILTARAENYLAGNPDLGDTIARLQAYQEAGADVLYAPALQTLDEIRSVLAEIDRPLNVLMGPMKGFVPLHDLADLGVRRISMGSAFASAASDALIKAAREVLEVGQLSFMDGTVNSAEISTLIMKGHARE